MSNYFINNFLEKNSGAEIWWDSCLSVYDNWGDRVLQQANSAQGTEVAEYYIQNFVNQEDICHSLIKGITTNPTLVYQGFLQSSVLKEVHPNNENCSPLPSPELQQLTWELYKRTIKETADKLLPMWEETNGQFGWVSGQITPDNIFNRAAMVKQGIELSHLSPNIMAKIPGSKEGYEAIEDLTSLGISINNTLSFTLPQFMACVEAIERGVQRAKERGIILERWRAVVTDMIGRYGDQGSLLAESKEKGIALTTEDIRWAELAILKKSYKLLQSRGTPVKILLSSLRIDEGKALCWHLQKTAGADLAYTLPPSFLESLIKIENQLQEPQAGAIDEDVPQEVLNKLSQLNYFQCAYYPDGMRSEDFNNHPALCFSVQELTAVYKEFLAFSENLLGLTQSYKGAIQ